MIPVRLVLKNFLSYGEPDPIEFADFDVVCLTGDNGVGKSALLDAITWAVFGAARGCESGQNQERLIRDGADEAVVEFTFELNGATYQIVRRRRRPKGKERAAKGNEVRFQVLTADGWTNLAKDTMRETDRYISSVVRMDYKTFVTSAFFLQNRADDFLARMTADERKDVFAKLLDLGTYELLEAAARERSRAAEKSRKELEAQAARLAADAPDPDVIASELDAARAGAEAAAVTETDADARAKTAAERVVSLEKEAAALQSELQGIEELEARLASDRSAAGAKGDELTQLDELLARTDEVEAAAAELAELRAAETAARADQSRAAALREQTSALAERVRSEEKAISTRVRQRDAERAKLAAEIGTLERAQAELDEVTEALSSSAGADTELERVNAELDDHRTRGSAADAEIAALDARITELRDKLDLLKDGTGVCPLCAEPLTAAHAKEIAASIRTQGKELTAERKRAESEREVHAKEVKRLREEAGRIASSVRERTKLEERRGALVVRAERLAVVRAELDRLVAETDADAALLASGAFAAEWKDELAALEREIADAYDPAAHDRLLGRIDELATFEELRGRLAGARERRPVVVAELDAARTGIEELAARVAERRAALAGRDDPGTALGAARADAESLGAELAALREATAQARAAVTRLEERLEAAHRAAAQSAEAREAERAAAAEHRRYDMLAKAFGPGGIPHRIIENARPELEVEANEILGHLSDYDMSLQLRLDRETRSGKTRETFDVLVHHDGGVRDFQMFSGGEAFRIAFAVRLALSKLLVRRAGARLETLVIDEGFGTQDPAGRERLVEAINLARSEFAKVLVITHLDELKGMFDAQIRVSKDEREGSRLEIAT